MWVSLLSISTLPRARVCLTRYLHAVFLQTWRRAGELGSTWHARFTYTIVPPPACVPRMQSLVAVTERFLQMPVFDVGLEKSLKIYGIGEFSYHSYLLFCRDAGAILKPKDAALAYVGICDVGASGQGRRDVSRCASSHRLLSPHRLHAERGSEQFR